MKSDPLNRVGFVLFLFYLLIAFLLRNHQTFFDEGSNLNLAACVLKGLHLYRDLFENHFPLPVYLSAAIIAITGTSLPLVRLAVLLLDAAMLLAAMRVSRLYFPIGFAAAIWALISPYYFGNLLLYDNLVMLAGIALGAVCFAALARGLAPSRGMFALLAIAGLVATMSSPFFTLVTCITIGSLFFAPQIPRSFVVKLGAAIALPILAYVTYLAATGALGAFYSYAVVFNTTTYQKYTSLPILPLIGKQLLLFDIFNPKWLSSLDPLRFNPVSFSPVFDHWIFSGLFYRVAALLAILLFALRRNYRTAIFLYLFIAALPLREDDQFHAAPFVLFCLFLTGVLLQEAVSLERPWKIALLTLCGVPTLLLATSGARYVARHALQSDFDRLIAEAGFIREAVQNHSDVQLGHYPYGNYMYYLTGLRPISKFVDFYPWVAEIGRPEVDPELARASSVILAMEVTGSIWTYPNAVTLQTEIAYARKHLIKESFGWLTVYVSPSLSMSGAAGTETVLSALAEPLDEGSRSKKKSVYQISGLSTVRLGPFRLADHTAMALPIMTGPDIHNLSVTVRDTSTDKLLAHLDPLPARTTWWAWRPDLSQDPELTFEIVAESKGTQSMSIGWPHWLRQPHPERATQPGVYRNGQWILGATQLQFGGQPGDIPVTGDWDGSGKTKPGIYRNGQWMILGATQLRFGGQPGDIPVTGDWDGSGKTKPGIYRNGEWILGASKYHLGGQPGDVPITGDWDGSGKTKPGIYRQNGEWLLYGLEQSFFFGGLPGDIPVVGDWNGDGRSKPGLFRGSTWLLDMDGNYKFEDLGTDTVVTLGVPGDKPVAGLW